MFKFLMVLALSTNMAYATSGQLIDFLFNGRAVEGILKKSGIIGEDSKRVTSYVAKSLDALNVDNKSNFTKADLMAALKKLPADRDSAVVRDEVTKLLNVPEDKLSKEQLVKAVDGLIYLANKYPRAGSFIVSCVGCAGDPLALHGFKYTISELSNTRSQKVLESMLPKDANDLPRYIGNKLKDLKAGNYTSRVAPEDEKSLALFLTLIKEGDKNQKDLASAIMEFSKTNGKADFSGNKLYTVFSSDMSPEAMQGWTEMLVQVSKDAKGGTSKRDAFYSYLEKKAGSNKALQGQLEKLKAKKCFFP